MLVMEIMCFDNGNFYKVDYLKVLVWGKLLDVFMMVCLFLDVSYRYL